MHSSDFAPTQSRTYTSVGFWVILGYIRLLARFCFILAFLLRNYLTTSTKIKSSPSAC